MCRGKEPSYWAKWKKQHLPQKHRSFTNIPDLPHFPVKRKNPDLTNYKDDLTPVVTRERNFIYKSSTSYITYSYRYI